MIAVKAGAFIRQASADRKPFIVYLPTYAPHGPCIEYSTGERELYDLTSDRHQLQNSAPSADPALISFLADRLHQLVRCSGAACQTR